MPRAVLPMTLAAVLLFTCLYPHTGAAQDRAPAGSAERGEKLFVDLNC